MIDSYKRFWTKGLDFKGRTNRSDYWLGAVLANLLAYIILLIVTGVLAAINETIGAFFSVLVLLYGLGQIIPSLSISIRRVRDMGKGWAWIFINLVPIIGGIWFIVLLCQPSVPIA